MIERLKPCPFCGGEACIVKHEFDGYEATYYGVVCLDCGVENRQSFTHKITSIMAWNRRTNDET